MENYESDIFMSQEGDASIDFTLLDRPNCNIASAPEATAALLPDVHVGDSSFASFDFLDGSGVDGLSGFPRGVDDNHSLELSRDNPDISRYKEQPMHPNTEIGGNGVAVANLQQSQYQMPYAVQKPVSSVDFFAKMPVKALQQQEQQSQLSLFNNEGPDENPDYYESGQASEPSHASGSGWWMPDTTPWMANNNQQQDQLQVNNRAATEDQRRLMQLKIGSSQASPQAADYPGALSSNSQPANSDPGPSMYSFLPTNTNQAPKMGQTSDAGLNSARVPTIHAPKTVKSLPHNPPYDFEGLLNGSGYQQQQQQAGGPVPNNMTLPGRLHFGNMNQESGQNQQQNQSMNKYKGQNMLEVSPLKVSDYDFFGGDYVIKGQEQGQLGEQIEEEEAQVWRQPPSRQQAQLNNHYASSSYEDMRQHQQQAQVHQHLQQQQQQQQLFSGNQNPSQASGNQFQAFLSDSSLHHEIPQVMPPEQAHSQMGLEHHHAPLMQTNFHPLNNSNARIMMYPGSDASTGQGLAIGYLLGQDNSFSWQQLAMKASGHDQPLYTPVNSVKRDAVGQVRNPYASVQGSAMHGFYGGMGKLPAAPSPHVNRPIPRSLGMGPSGLFGPDGRSEVFNMADQSNSQAGKFQAPPAKMLFGQTVQQQPPLPPPLLPPPPPPVKNPQGFSSNLHSKILLSANQQSMEEMQSRHHHHQQQQQQQQQQSVRTNAAQQQQQGGPAQVKLFAQSLTPLDHPMQQNLMARNSDSAQHQEQARAMTALQQSSFNVLQARNQTMGASPSNYYQQGSTTHAGGGFSSTSTNDAKQKSMWNSYDLEPDASQVELPMGLTAGNSDEVPMSLMAGTSDDMLKNQWTGLSETQARADAEVALTSGRLKAQQSLWGNHNLQQSELANELDSMSPGMQTSHGSQETVGGQAIDGSQLNGNNLQQSSIQPGTTISSMTENERQEEMQSSQQQESSWRDQSRLQPSPPQAAAPSNSSFQAFTDVQNRPQRNWKSLWQDVPDTENTSQLAEIEKQQQQQNTLWGQRLQPQSSSHGGGSQSQSQLPNHNAGMSQTSWSGPQNSSQAEQLFQGTTRQQQQQQHYQNRQQQQVLMPGSSESGHVYQDVDGRQQPSNHGPNFLQGMGHPSQLMADRDSTSGSAQGGSILPPQDQDHGYHHGAAYPQSNASGDGRQTVAHNNSVGSTSENQYFLQYANPPSGQANLQQQGGGGSNGWSPQISRQGVDNLTLAAQLENVDLRQQQQHQQQQQQQQQDGRVQLQLSNHQTENSFSALMKAKGPASLQEESSAGESGMLGLKSFQMGTTAATYRQQAALDRMAMQNRYPENMLAQRAGLAFAHGAVTFPNGLFPNVKDVRTSSDPGMLSGNTLELLSNREQEDRRTTLQTEALKHQETAMENGAVNASGISLAHLRRGAMGNLLQRPTPSRPESLSRELELQLARSLEAWPQGRPLPHEYREESQAYGQQQAATQSLRAGPLLSNVPHGEQSQLQERGDSGSMMFPGARLPPHDISRQAALIYKSLNPAARIQFASQFAQQFARAGGTLPSLDTRSSAQNLSGVGYDRASTSTWVTPGKPTAGGGQSGCKWPAQQPGAIQVAEAASITPPPPKKLKPEPPPFVPWRIAITQAATHLPTISRSEMEWAAATSCLPEQDVSNEVGPEPLDVNALCMKRARRRLKLTTQLMQQLIPALPCRLFKGSTAEDKDNTVFLLAKFAVTEACLLATGVSKERNAVTIREQGAPDSNGNCSSEKSQQQMALVKNINPAIPDQLQIHLKQRMTQLNNELTRMENAPSAWKLLRECNDLDKLSIVTRLERFHPGMLAGFPNSSLRSKHDSRVESNVVTNFLRPFPERHMSAVTVPTQLPENVLLRPL